MPRSSGSVEASSDDEFIESTPRNTTSTQLHSRTPLSKSLRRLLGIGLLLITVTLWTASNFLASNIFADHTYSKPYLIVYFNTAFFTLPLIPLLALRPLQARSWLPRWSVFTAFDDGQGRYHLVDEHDAVEESARKPTDPNRDDVQVADRPALQVSEGDNAYSYANKPLTIQETARVSLYFCFTWFIANYFTAACLEYTTVASATILTSTSSIWTLVIGAAMSVEKVTLRKLMGVLASLLGIVLISRVDYSGENDKNRGSFPYKSPAQIAIGDVMALLSAVLYGVYTISLKKKLGDESRVSMPLLFGLVGLFNILILWPGIIVLHLTGIEPFELPPTQRVVVIVLVNAVIGMISDICWAFAMLLASPLIATVGLSLTIPMSLVGQMILDSQYSSLMYWFGACIVVSSFVLVSYESKVPPDDMVLAHNREGQSIIGR